MEQEDHEWELSKENVQPLKEGRSMSFLAAALHSDQEEHTLKNQQNEFEVELRTYSGDDPFDVWDRYIKWTEQNFPKGGHDGQQITLIERCLREYQTNEKYLNDVRYIRLWTKFACYSDDPVDVYKYMYDNSIGLGVALLYVEWASAVERKGDMKSADQVYNNGLKQCAQPRDLLLQRHQQFQSRVAKNIRLQMVESRNPGLNLDENEEKRITLGRLKPKGASCGVGVTRTGSVVIGSAGSLKDSRALVSKQLPAKGIPIFCDSENASQHQPLPTHEWQSLPVKHIDNVENEKKPGVWSNAKVKQKPGTVPSVAQACPFEIHVDQESQEQAIITPRKTTLISHTQPLSCHKAPKTDVLSSVRPQENKEPSNEVVMYQKDKIYNGLSEFSFEELRAIKYWKEKKEREAEARRLQQEEERKKTEEDLRKQLKETEERLARLEAMIPMMAITRTSLPSDVQVQSSMQAVVPSQPIVHVQSQPSPCESSQIASVNTSSCSNASAQIPTTSTPSTESTNSVCDLSNSNQTPTNVLSSISLPSESSSLTSSDKKEDIKKENTSVKRTPMFNSLSTYSSLTGNTSLKSFKPSIMKLNEVAHVCPASSSKVPVGQAPGVSSHEHINQSQESFHLAACNDSLSASLGKTPDSFSLKKKHTAPSPTVCTKEAMQCVMGMFSAPFNNSGLSTSLEESNVSVLHSTQGNPSVGSRRPLEFIDDGSSAPPVKRLNLKSGLHSITEKGPLMSGAHGGLQIYCDSDIDNSQQIDQHVQTSASKSLQVSKDQPMLTASTKKGLQVYEDQPMLTASTKKGLQVYEDKPMLAASTKKGLQVYEDKPMLAASTKKGLQVYEDKPMLTASTKKGLQVYEYQPMLATSSNKGLQVYEDQPTMPSTKKGLQIYQDQSKSSACNSLQIYQDQPMSNALRGFQVYHEGQITEHVLESRSVMKTVRRGLAFAGSDDLEMVEDERTLQINKDFTIMGQAVSDLTLAPLENFTMHNKIASTPIAGPLSPLGREFDLPGMTVEFTSSALVPVASHTSEGEHSTPGGNHLSPIMEGGESGSSEESAQQSQATKSSETMKTEKLACTRLESLHEEQNESREQKNAVQSARETLQDLVVLRDQEDVCPLPIVTKGNRLEKSLLDSSCHHHIDTTAYLNTEETCDDLSKSLALDPRDPFDENTIAQILNQLEPPLSSYPNYYTSKTSIPPLARNSVFRKPGTDEEFYIREMIGEGGYATVYQIIEINMTLSDTQTQTLSLEESYSKPEIKALKVQSPACYWEFYIICELRKRLTQLKSPIDVRPSVIEIYQSCFFQDASALIMDYMNQGSLLDLVNKYKNVPSLLAEVEPFAVLMTVELLHMFEQIHKCDIIHGDVKPDNFLLMSLPDVKRSTDPKDIFGNKLKLLKLIDFGQSIDMRQFKKGTTFTAKVVTSGFQCIEMRTDRPWTYQTDLFGLAGTIHVVLFGSYMNVYQEHGVWKMTGNFVRKWNVPLWKNLFYTLLNIPSCHQQPDLAELRKPFEEYSVSKIGQYTKWRISLEKV
ncbi:checkpoint serine/threonine-protein kinase BUB1-like isoform X1 [Biomphalaria pfeifferi]|uniref:Checkpoint serine/threonine-protein kinase BUB1-like isoform X1 n=1 Tax=Biomphalaria pfeifferi TaxID=112525 RepID=A0AAD8B189_BIOPF|nr:checkpoint serine/threonine-protein kinase BUB1-like isoform X1 [Biomphalaria pfeifferi]